MITVVQPAVPHYRLDYFQRLADHYKNEFKVWASPDPLLGVLMQRDERPAWEGSLGPVRSLLNGVDWQFGALKVAVRRDDILVVSGAPRNLSNILLMIRARAKGAKVVWWGHYHSPTSTTLRRFLRLILMRGSSALLFYTEKEVHDYRQSWAGRNDNRPIFALNNGLDTVPITQLRQRYDPERRENAAIFVGRITAKSQLDVAIRAIAMGQDRSFKLYVVGSGDYQVAAQALAQDLGVSDQIIWVPPTTNEVKIAAVANRCRVFLYPGDVGLSLIHGLAYGLPVVLHSDFEAHMPEIAAFEEGKNGQTFNRGDPASLASILNTLPTDLRRLSALSVGAVASVEKEFNTLRMAERFIAMVNAIRVPH